MEFKPKDFEQLHTQKIRLGLDNRNISQEYFYCLGEKMIFIKKSRKNYKIMASCQCNFEPQNIESCLQVVYTTPDVSKAIQMFCSYVLRTIDRNSWELFQ